MTSAAAVARRAELRAAKWGKPVPPTVAHGTKSYARTAYGCDCKACLPSGKRRTPNGQGQTAKERTKALRLRKKGKPVPEGTKHGVYAYRTYACRCAVCTAAMEAKRPGTTWRDKAYGRWAQALTPAGSIDIICWRPANAGPDWQCPDPSHLEAS